MMSPRVRTIILGCILVTCLVSAFDVAVAESTRDLSGFVFFDRNADGDKDSSEPFVSFVSVGARSYGSDGPSPVAYSIARSAMNGQFRGRVHGVTLLTIQSGLGPERTGPLPYALQSPPTTVRNDSADASQLRIGLIRQPSPRDEHYDASSRYRIDTAWVWQYSQLRGHENFGAPLSGTFPEFGTGRAMQIFEQRVLAPFTGEATSWYGPINLLDDFYLGGTSLAADIFPPLDISTLPPVPPLGEQGASRTMAAYYGETVPETWEGQPIDFLAALRASAQPAIANDVVPEDAWALIALELWGLPTSRPAAHPDHPDIVYQRFQRGVLKYDPACACATSVPVGRAFRSLLTGEDERPDGVRLAAPRWHGVLSPQRLDTEDSIHADDLVRILAMIPPPTYDPSRYPIPWR